MILRQMRLNARFKNRENTSGRNFYSLCSMDLMIFSICALCCTSLFQWTSFAEGAVISDFLDCPLAIYSNFSGAKLQFSDSVSQLKGNATHPCVVRNGLIINVAPSLAARRAVSINGAVIDYAHRHDISFTADNVTFEHGAIQVMFSEQPLLEFVSPLAFKSDSDAELFAGSRVSVLVQNCNFFWGPKTEDMSYGGMRMMGIPPPGTQIIIRNNTFRVLSTFDSPDPQTTSSHVQLAFANLILSDRIPFAEIMMTKPASLSHLASFRSERPAFVTVSNNVFDCTIRTTYYAQLSNIFIASAYFVSSNVRFFNNTVNHGVIERFAPSTISNDAYATSTGLACADCSFLQSSSLEVERNSFELHVDRPIGFLTSKPLQLFASSIFFAPFAIRANASVLIAENTFVLSLANCSVLSENALESGSYPFEFLGGTLLVSHIIVRSLFMGDFGTPRLGSSNSSFSVVRNNAGSLVVNVTQSSSVRDKGLQTAFLSIFFQLKTSGEELENATSSTDRFSEFDAMVNVSQNKLFTEILYSRSVQARAISFTSVLTSQGKVRIHIESNMAEMIVADSSGAPLLTRNEGVGTINGVIFDSCNFGYHAAVVVAGNTLFFYTSRIHGYKLFAVQFSDAIAYAPNNAVKVSRNEIRFKSTDLASIHRRHRQVWSDGSDIETFSPVDNSSLAWQRLLSRDLFRLSALASNSGLSFPFSAKTSISSAFVFDGIESYMYALRGTVLIAENNVTICLHSRYAWLVNVTLIGFYGPAMIQQNTLSLDLNTSVLSPDEEVAAFYEPDSRLIFGVEKEKLAFHRGSVWCVFGVRHSHLEKTQMFGVIGIYRNQLVFTLDTPIVIKSSTNSSAYRFTGGALSIAHYANVINGMVTGNIPRQSRITLLLFQPHCPLRSRHCHCQHHQLPTASSTLPSPPSRASTRPFQRPTRRLPSRGNQKYPWKCSKRQSTSATQMEPLWWSQRRRQR